MSNDYLRWLLDGVVLAPNLAYRINELTIQLQAADKLAKELNSFVIPQDPRAVDIQHFLRISDALAAYEKVRGMK